MADITFKCERCGKQLVVDEQGIGLEVPCPECAAPLRIPADAPRVLEEPADAPPEAVPEMLDAARDEQRTAQMLNLLREVVGETDKVAQGLHALAPEPADAKPKPETPTTLEGKDAVDILSGGLGLVREKLVTMTAEIESAGGRIQELTQLGNKLQSRLSEGEAHKRRLQEEISIITKTSSQRIVLGDDAAAEATPPLVLSPASPPPESALPRSIWQSGAFLIFLLLQLIAIGGVAAYFLTRNLPEVVVVSPLAHTSPSAGEAAELGRTLSFGPAKVLFGAPDEESADSALLGEAPRAASGRKYLVFPVTLTNTSATQPVYLRYLWSDAELVLPDGRILRPVRLASGPADAATSSQTMEPGAAVTEQLVFPLPEGPLQKLSLRVLPGIWSRGDDKKWTCLGRMVSFRLPPAKPRPAP